MTSTTIDRTVLARRVGTSSAAPDSLQGLYSLRPGAIWAFFRRQSMSFWMVCLYMLFEYVRPQAIYSWLNAVPWAQLLILGAPIAFLLEGGKVRARNPINLWMVFFTGAVVLSWLFAVYPTASQDKMFIYINWVLVYFLVANVNATEGRFFIFLLLFLLASFKMSQHGARIWALRGFGFAKWGATGAPGWFHNSGEFGIQMCVFFPMTLYFIGGLKKHWSKTKRLLALALPSTALMSLVATNSRGALLGAAAVAMWMLLRTKYRARALVGLGLATVVVIAVMPEETKQRFTTMGEDETSQNRFTYWKNGIRTYKQYPLTGIGYENWADYYRNNYGHTALPHNIFIQAGAELGTLGVVGLLGLIGSSFLVNYRTRKLVRNLGEQGHFISMSARGLDGAMIGYIASAFFVTVLFYPYIWFALGMTSALHAAAVAAAAQGQPVARSPAPFPVPRQGAGWRSIASATVAQRARLQPPRSPGPK